MNELWLHGSELAMVCQVLKCTFAGCLHTDAPL
jgi:hypothetical protein